MAYSLSGVLDYLKRSVHVKLFIIYLAIALVMFWQVAANLANAVPGNGGDVFTLMFSLWWAPYAVFVLHQTPYFTHLLYYPVGANLLTDTIMPLSGILTVPFQAVSLPFAYNILFFTGYAFSGLFMFMLAEYVTKNKYASFIAGLVYAFSPVHIAQSYGHLDWTVIEFIPLFILLFLMAIRQKKAVYAVMAGLSFVLLTFMGDIEQGIMMLLFAAAALVFMAATERSEIFNMHAAKSLLYVLASALIIGSPFLAGMVLELTPAALGEGANGGYIVLQNMMYSNNLLSFFLPGYYNGIFHGISLSYLTQVYGFAYQGAQYTVNTGDRTAYAGYAVLILAAIGVYNDYRNHRAKNVLMWLSIGAVFAWLSLGPYLQVGSVTTGIPTIDLIYLHIPFFNIIKEPGRFDVVVSLCLAVLAAFGASHLLKDHKDSLKYAAILSAIILIEYNGMPLSGQFANSLITQVQTPQIYSQISGVRGNFSVLVLPALSNDSATPELYPGMGTYYITLMHKPLIGGYTSRENQSEINAVQYIPLALSASYLQYGYGFEYPSPINENISNLTILQLASDNAAYISVVRSAYNHTDQNIIYSYLYSIFGDPVYIDNTTFTFSTQSALQERAYKSVVAYTIGNWTPGYEYCDPYLQCNVTIEDMWWGDNPRGIILFSPKDQEISMSFDSISQNRTTLGIYLDNEPVASANLSAYASRHSVNMTVTEGFSEVAFYSEGAGQGPLGYGMENVTFTPK